MKNGRPKGAKNIRELGEVEPSRCSACGSSRRTSYENSDYRDYADHGLEFIGIYYRTCRCQDCGQARRDREKVYSPNPRQSEVDDDSAALRVRHESINF